MWGETSSVGILRGALGAMRQLRLKDLCVSHTIQAGFGTRRPLIRACWPRGTHATGRRSYFHTIQLYVPLYHNGAKSATGILNNLGAPRKFLIACTRSATILSTT